MRALLVVVLLLARARRGRRPGRRRHRRGQGGRAARRQGRACQGTPDGRHHRLPVPHPGGGRPLRRRPHLARPPRSSASPRAPAPTSPCTACTCRCPSVLSGSVEQVPVDRIDGTATLSYALLSAQLGGRHHAAPRGRRPADHQDGRGARADDPADRRRHGHARRQRARRRRREGGRRRRRPARLPGRPGQRPARPALRRPGAAVRAAADRRRRPADDGVDVRVEADGHRCSAADGNSRPDRSGCCRR